MYNGSSWLVPTQFTSSQTYDKVIYIAKKPHIHGMTSLQTSKFLLK